MLTDSLISGRVTPIIPMLIGLSGSVLLLILLTLRWQVPAFLALLIASYVAGFCVGMPANEIMTQVMVGFGTTLGDIGLTIALGALLGVLLQNSGATTAIANGIIRILGGRYPGLALAIIGYIVSIPVYCDSGFIILDSVRQHLAKQHKVSPVFLSVVLGCALYATHTLVPPTPGPLAALTNFHLTGHLPAVLLLGLFFSMLALCAGFLWALYSARTLSIKAPQTSHPKEHDSTSPLSFGLALFPVILPMLLICLGGLSPKESSWGYWLAFIGHPVNALMIGLISCWFLILKAGVHKELRHHLMDGLETGGRIILVVGCGGAFGYILRGSGLSELLTGVSGLEHWGLMLPFLTAALIKTAEGSATVALITASALIEPLLPALGLDSTTGRLLALFSCGGGAMTVAHVNDSFFWVIAEFTGMDTATALKTLTAATFFQGIAVLAGVQVMALWL